MAKDCTLTSMGLTPSTYQRSATHLQAGLAAATRIVPRNASGVPQSNGQIRIVGIGMSNARLYFKPESGLLKNAPDRHPAIRLVNVAKGGHTATEWASLTHPVWASAVNQVIQSGATALQVQAAHVYMTQDYPVTSGQMTAGQVSAILQNLRHYFPNVSVVYLSPIGYTGYAVPPDADRAPVWAVHADSLLMAAMVTANTAWPSGLWVDVLDIWADGLTANPKTISQSFPTGLTYRCEDVVEDGVHPSEVGALRVAQNVLERWRLDAVTHGWMFTP